MSFVSRGFRGRRQPDADSSRVPPGQYVTRDFPVLSAGPTPHTRWSCGTSRSSARWTSRAGWTWDEFHALPERGDHRRHPLRDQVVEARHGLARASPSTRSSTASRRPPSTSSQFGDGGYTTNLPLEDVTGGKAWVVVRATTASRCRPSTAARRGCWCRTSTSGRARSGSAGCGCTTDDEPGLLGDQRLPQLRRPVAGTALLGRLTWQLADVVERRRRRRRASRRSSFDVPGWPGHRAGQHVDVRLTAEDGYQAERSYSIASAPDGTRARADRRALDDGEVSPYLTDELRRATRSSCAARSAATSSGSRRLGGPLLLVGGGSGVVPLMAMIRHRAAAGQRRRHAAAPLLAQLGRRHLPRRARAAERRRPHRRRTR